MSAVHLRRIYYCTSGREILYHFACFVVLQDDVHIDRTVVSELHGEASGLREVKDSRFKTFCVVVVFSPRIVRDGIKTTFNSEIDRS